MASYSLFERPGNNYSLSAEDDHLWGYAFNWNIPITVDGLGGTDVLALDYKQSDITGLSITTNDNVTGIEGRIVRVTEFFGMTTTTQQYIDIELVNFEKIRFNSDGGGHDWVTVGAVPEPVQPPLPVSTQDYLMGNFGITMAVAQQWIMDHINQPAQILAVCKAGGLTADMLADVVQPAFADVTLTGQMINAWFQSHSLDVL